MEEGRHESKACVYFAENLHSNVTDFNTNSISIISMVGDRCCGSHIIKDKISQAND